jgi:hypothetical protein
MVTLHTILMQLVMPLWSIKVQMELII